MQIKTTMRYHHTPMRSVKIQNTDNIKCWWGCGETESLIHGSWECKMCRFKHILTIWSSNQDHWHLLKRIKDFCPHKPLCKLLCASLLNCFICVWLFATLWTVACQALLSMGFSRQEYCSPLGDLPNPGTECASPSSLALQADSLPLGHQGSPYEFLYQF